MSNGLTPPPERDFPAGRLQQRKEQLVSQISADSSVFVPQPSAATPRVCGRHRRRRPPQRGHLRRVRRSPGPRHRSTTIGCYETDSLEANTAVLAAGTKSPVAACARAYASAFPGSQQPAHFAACVLPSGAVGVFPSETTGDTCKNLGLATVAGTRGSQPGSK